MNKEDIIMTLKNFKEGAEDREVYRFTEEDVEFFNEAIRWLERTAQEVPVQEQYKEFEDYHSSYPNEISITVGLSLLKKIGIEEANKKDNEAITVKVNVDSSLYNKKEVTKSLKYAFYKILKSYE